MDQTNERKKMPAEAVDLYSQFIHGEIGRRDFLDGLKRFAIRGLSVTAMVVHMPLDALLLFKTAR